MKSLYLALLFTIGTFSISFAQSKAVEKTVISTPTVNCEDCKTRIENRLVHEFGVSSVKADYHHHNVTVVWYTDRTNLEDIKAALANLGFDADDIPANISSYNKLPKTCQHHAGDKPVKPKD